MSRTRSHLVRSLRTGAHGALVALVVGLTSGLAAFVLSDASVPGAVEAAGLPLVPLAADVATDRLRAVPDFVAPTPPPSTEEAPPEGAATIHAALAAAEEPAVAASPAPAPIVAAPAVAATASPRPVALAAPVAAAPAAAPADHAAIIDAIHSVWPAELAETAVLVAACESSMNPAARNPYSGAAGLFQSLGHGPVPADAYSQAVQALAIYEEAGGWGPWVSSAHCWR